MAEFLNNEVYVCRGIPIDANYTHTRLFKTVQEQLAYFTTHAKYSYNNFAVVRFNQQIRLPVDANKISDCNYVVFKNSDFGDKIYYCFITAINWVNMGRCDISFEIDLMQTFMFDIVYKPCFIERQHAIYDDIQSECLIPESLNVGTEFVNNDMDVFLTFGEMKIGIYSQYDLNGNIITGELINGVFTGAKLYEFTTNQLDTIKRYIDTLSEKGLLDGILCVFMYPDVCSPNKALEYGGFLQPPKDIKGYVPKNNKLFTYPYSFILCDNNLGTTATYKWEYCNNINFVMNIYGACATAPSTIAVPQNYKGIAQNYNEAITTAGFPICSWSGNSFQNYIANNKNSLAISAITSLGAIAAGGALIGFTGGIGAGGALIAGGASNLINKSADLIDKSTAPAQSKGSVMNESLNVALGRCGISLKSMSVSQEVAISIDNFFTVYGYAKNAIAIPNINSRPYWNYVKCQNASIGGNITQTDKSRIEDILNNGITFWHTDDVGNYSLNNDV